jgi:hypothetical protein
MSGTQKKLILLITIASVVRCIVAATVELGNDEVYYVSYAEHLQWNYFDHPPFVALLIRFGTINQYFNHEFFIRAGALVLAAANTWLVFGIATKIKSETAGLVAAALFTASPYCSIIAGTFILPDSPQLFFWILALYILVTLVDETVAEIVCNRCILLFGLAAGLCIMSKVHGIFLWLGLGLYIVLYNRKLLKNKYLYLAAIISAVIVSPVLFWNIENKFVTWAFHSGRVTIDNGIHADSFFKEMGGQLFYNNPLSVLLFAIALYGISRNKGLVPTPQRRILLLTGLPLIVCVLLISLFRDTLPHWSGPGYTALIIYAACYISGRQQAAGYLYRLVKASLIFVAVIIVGGLILIQYYPGTLSPQKGVNKGDGDFTLDMYGWEESARLIDSVWKQDLANGKINPDFVVLSNKWFPAGHIDYYIAKPLDHKLFAIGPLDDIHHYYWLNSYRGGRLPPSGDAYFITVSSNYCNPADVHMLTCMATDAPVILPVYRNGKLAKNIWLYRLHSCMDKMPAL